MARIGSTVAQMFELTADDVCYVAMPLFHSNALMAGWAPALAAGATLALRERFSASQFLPDVRRYGATYFNYVGKPLSYILDTPERPDDADNPLRRAFGNEAAEADVARFAERFGCAVQDAYGSTEGGAAVQRTPDTPRGALGRAAARDPDRRSGDRRGVPPGRLRRRRTPAQRRGGHRRDGQPDRRGRVRGLLAQRRRRRRPGCATAGTGPGDLAYRDENDFFYFGGRDYDWLRVDGENFAAAPVEEVLQRHPDVVLASVYAVPDTVVGDQVMATLLLGDGTGVRPGGIRRVPGRRADMGTKWAPRYVRISDAAPGHRHHQGPQAGAAGRGLAVPGPGVVATREGCAVPAAAPRRRRRPGPGRRRPLTGWAGVDGPSVVARRPSSLVDRRPSTGPKTTSGDVGEDPGRRRLPVERPMAGNEVGLRGSDPFAADGAGHGHRTERR